MTQLSDEKPAGLISYRRALTSAEAFGKLLGRTPGTWLRGTDYDLVAAGTAFVTGLGNPAPTSKQDEFEKQFQRVSMEVNLPPYSFTLDDCLNVGKAATPPKP